MSKDGKDDLQRKVEDYIYYKNLNDEQVWALFFRFSLYVLLV